MVRLTITSLPLPSGPSVAVIVDYFAPPPRYTSGNSYVLLFMDWFSRRVGMCTVSATELTVEGATDILVNKYIPIWGCPAILFTDT